ncbi:hypothetical protein CBR_g37058 [Chara braunii]|uniref:Uncharacterized protein n=1 Tax=Chara braunii TaxID=69332 RepID=A0A388LM27_CHABU|nr:hypothetical protein CBR_g37058 [Chara braunii]|eukprot:GBG83344.1 hypothetical protein CBR_g37058 [Chara braunii]
MARPSTGLLLATPLICLALCAVIPSVHGLRRLSSGCGGCPSSCDTALKGCDFYFYGHENNVPKIKLIRKGDNTIYVRCGHILHRVGYDTRPVKVVNSASCAILQGRTWNTNACQHRLYGNGRHLASREFNVGNPSDFLNACIKVQISAAQYEDGGNFNNGHKNPRACIVVKTERSFG